MSTHAQREELVRDLREIEHASLTLLKRINDARAAVNPPLPLLQLPARFNLAEVPDSDAEIGVVEADLRKRLDDYIDGAERLTEGLGDDELTQEVRARADILRKRLARAVGDAIDEPVAPTRTHDPAPPASEATPAVPDAAPLPAPDPTLPPPTGSRTRSNIKAWLGVVHPKRKVEIRGNAVTIWTSSTRGWTYDDAAGFDDLIADVLAGAI